MFQVSVIVTVFTFGLRTTFDDLRQLIRRPALLLRSLAAVLVIMPVMVIAAVQLLSLPRTVEIVLVALAISPVPPLLPNRQRQGRTHDSYGLGLMAILSLLSIVTVPLSVEVVQLVAGRPLGVAPGTIASIVMRMAIGPLAAGLAVRAFAPAAADRLGPIATMFARVLLLAAVVTLLVGAWRLIWDAASPVDVAALAGFVVAGLTVGHFLAGRDRGHALVLGVSSGCRHPMIALTIASANFPEQRFAPLMLVYIIVNALLGAAYIAWSRRTASAV